MCGSRLAGPLLVAVLPPTTSQQVSGAISVLAILGTALAVQQVLADTNLWHLLAYTGGALAATAGLLATATAASHSAHYADSQYNR